MKTLLSLLLLSFSVVSFTQQSSDSLHRKHELGIAFDDIFANTISYNYAPLDYYIFSSSSYIPRYIYNTEIQKPKLGLSYKYHMNNCAFRSKVYFNIGNSNTDRDDNSNQLTDNTNNNSANTDFYNIGTNVGFEFQKKFDRSMIFYGIDLGYNYSKYFTKQISSIERYNTSGDIEYMNMSSTRSSQQAHIITISPLLGAKYYITSAISVSTEIKLMVEKQYSENSYINYNYYKSSSSSITQYNENNDSDNKNQFNLGFGPVGHISFNFHF